MVTDNITRLELELHKHLQKASYLLQDIRLARQEVTDPGLKRRGWGMDNDMMKFQSMTETVVYDILSGITEYGGGTTSDQDERLEAVQQALASLADS